MEDFEKEIEDAPAVVFMNEGANICDGLEKIYKKKAKDDSAR